MNILILGAGQVGSALAKSLASDPINNITVIDIDEEKLLLIQRYLDIKTITGNGAYPNILEDANIVDMDMLIAVTNSDEQNMIACQMAHSLYNVKKKIARIRTIEYLKHDELFNKSAIPIDHVITPEELVTTHIKRIIEEPGSTQVLDFENGYVKLVTVKAYQGTPIVGRPIKELHEHLPRNQVRVVALYRNEKAITAYGDTIIESGDSVYFIAKQRHISNIIKEFRRREKTYKNIMIAGGGNIGFKLAQALEGKCNIRIIELDNERVKEIAGELDKTIVLSGNASDESLLLEEGIRNTDLFLALTDYDETNVVISLLAKKLGADKVLTLVKRTAYVDLIQQSGIIDISLSPDQITTSRILTYTRKGDTMAVYSLRYGKAEALEVIVHGNEITSNVVGRKIGQIELPDGVKIGCIVRDEVVIMGTHDVVIKENDHIIIVLTNVSKIHEVESLFTDIKNAV